MKWRLLPLVILLFFGETACAKPDPRALLSALEKDLGFRRKEAQVLGRTIDLSGLARWEGSKPVSPPASPGTEDKADILVVHVWATWCGPCLEEFPVLGQVFASLPSDKGVSTILVSDDDDPDVLAHFLETKKGLLPKQPLYKNTDGRLRASLQLGTALPVTLILDRERVVRQAFIGSLSDRRNQLVASVETLSEGVSCKPGGNLANKNRPRAASIGALRISRNRELTLPAQAKAPPDIATEWRYRLAELGLLHQAVDPEALLHKQQPAKGAPRSLQRGARSLLLSYIPSASCEECKEQVQVVAKLGAALRSPSPSQRTPLRDLKVAFVSPKGVSGPSPQEVPGNSYESQNILFARGCASGSSKESLANLLPQKVGNEPVLLLLDRDLVVRQAFVGPLYDRRNEVVFAVERLYESLGSVSERTN